MQVDTVRSLLRRKHRACYLKLLAYYQQVEIRVVVEIGVFRGKNALAFREMFPSAHLYLIDPWKPMPAYLESGSAVSLDPSTYESAWLCVNEQFGHDPNVSLIRKTSCEALNDVSQGVDLLFIDADHSYQSVRRDILLWHPKVVLGGILAGHNYGRKRLPGVKRAVDEIFKHHMLIGQDEVWAHVKKGPHLQISESK